MSGNAVDWAVRVMLGLVVLYFLHTCWLDYSFHRWRKRKNRELVESYEKTWEETTKDEAQD